MEAHVFVGHGIFNRRYARTLTGSMIRNVGQGVLEEEIAQRIAFRPLVESSIQMSKSTRHVVRRLVNTSIEGR